MILTGVHHAGGYTRIADNFTYDTLECKVVHGTTVLIVDGIEKVLHNIEIIDKETLNETTLLKV